MAYPFAQFDIRTPPAAEGFVPLFLSRLPFVRRSTKGTTSGYRKPPTNQQSLWEGEDNGLSVRAV